MKKIFWAVKMTGISDSESNPCSFTSLELLESSLRMTYGKIPDSLVKVIDEPGFKEWIDKRDGSRIVARVFGTTVGRLYDEVTHL